jgi:hypothetical protein
MERSDIQETLVSLYLRLNGYFLTGFIVHATYGTGTEVDVLGTRFPHHQEPEREIECCTHLGIPKCLDFIVGEVKGGLKNVNFNSGFREDRQAIGAVLHRFGAFRDTEIERVCDAVPGLLSPAALQRRTTFPSLEVEVSGEPSVQQGSLRFIPFAPEQSRPLEFARPYVFGDDMLSFVWKCFRPEQRRQRSGVRYNFDLWGSQFVQMVEYFKDRRRSAPGTIDDLYAAYGA